MIIKLRHVRQESYKIVDQLSLTDLEQEIRVYFKPDDWQRMLGHEPSIDAEPAYQPEKKIDMLMKMHYSVGMRI